MKKKMPRVAESILHDNPLCKGVVEVIEVQFKNGKGTLTRPERPRMSSPPPLTPLTPLRSPAASKFLKKLRSSKACVDLINKEEDKSDECSVLGEVANKANISVESPKKSASKHKSVSDENEEPVSDSDSSDEIEVVFTPASKTDADKPSTPKRSTRSCTKAEEKAKNEKPVDQVEPMEVSEVPIVDKE
ncbi:hypothetical protein FHG87_014934, partial [Trinorchestia longiramus]